MVQIPALFGYCGIGNKRGFSLPIAAQTNHGIVGFHRYRATEKPEVAIKTIYTTFFALGPNSHEGVLFCELSFKGNSNELLSLYEPCYIGQGR